jgi:TolA-binding protein
LTASPLQLLSAPSTILTIMNRKTRRAAQKKSKHSPAYPNPSNSTGFLYDVALGHYQAGKLAQAERVCGEILEIQPTHGIVAAIHNLTAAR